MLPGKKYTPEELLGILRRKIWLVLVPFATVAASTAMVVRHLPDVYKAEAIIQLQPPRVPVSLVRTGPAGPVDRLSDRLPAIRQQMLSRAKLERVIQDLNLYPEERRAGILEDIIEGMRGSVVIALARGDTFTISFTAPEARTAFRVTERLSSLVIEEGLLDRQALAEGTDQFLETQLEEVHQRLLEHEKRLEQYQRKFAGELPTQSSANLQAVQNLQSQTQALVQSINRDQERRIILERQVADLESAVDAAAPAPAVLAAGGGTTAQQLQLARVQLAQAQLKMRPDHPDIQTMKRLIRDLEQKLETELLETPLSADGSRSLTPAEQKRRRDLADARSQIEQLDRQVTRNQAEIQRLQDLAEGYLKRAQAGPTRETEMIELNREYNTLNNQYLSLLAKREEAKIAANLERRQVGEQFRLIDPPRMPTRPASPNRVQLNLIGLALGLAIGLGFVAAREHQNSTFQTDDEVTDVLSLPVLAVVPLMESVEEHRHRRRLRLLMGMGFGAVVVVCLAVVTYTFIR